MATQTKQLTRVRLITFGDSEVTIGDSWEFDTREEATAHMDDMDLGPTAIAVLTDLDGTVGEVKQ